MTIEAYSAFLADKAQLAEQVGFLDAHPDEVHPLLKPHQRDTVVWAVRGGRRAVFASFGLGKTFIQLEIVRLALAKLGGGRGLIILPLGVRQEFIRDAAKLDLTVRFIRSLDDAEHDGIYLTNYETVRDGRLDPRQFQVVSLDEAAVLRGLGGTKTFREFMRLYEGSDNYRFVATATPSPNEYIELLAYAAFLDVMDVGQAKTRFFKRDSSHADRLTLHPHMEAAFWLWVSSWAMFLQKPSDLGHDDTGYELPPLDVRWHEVPSTAEPGDAQTVDGRPMLFRDAAFGVSAAAAEKRTSIDVRVQAVLEIMTHGRKSSGTRARQASTADRGVQGVSAGIPTELLPQDAGAEARADAGRRAPEDLRPDRGAVPGAAGGAGRRVPNLHPPADEAAGGPRPRHGQGPRAAVPAVQHGHWDAGRQPGATDGGRGVSAEQFVVWCELNEEQRRLERALDAAGITYSSLYGSQDPDKREAELERWRAGATQVFISKPSMYGAGVNFQQCHRMLFVGITFKFSETIQAIHRVYRFLQAHPVQVDLIYTEAERGVRAQLARKWAQHNELVARMGEIMRTYKLSSIAMGDSLQRAVGVERVEAAGEQYRLVNNDTVVETAAMADASVDLIVTSIPFATQYEYTPSYNDFGHTEDNDHFWRQMDFLTPQLLRVLAPGRVCAVHVKDRIVPGGLTGLGFQTVEPFSDQTVAHFRRHGFAFLARRTIVTDVVRENNQTYRLGWSEQCKDGSRMGAGMPEYLLLFRRPPSDPSSGYADVPVRKDKAAYSRARWQNDAHGFWRSSGDRPLTAADLESLPHDKIFQRFRAHSLGDVYDYEADVTVGEALTEQGRLPTTFMLLQPASWHPQVWTDVARMRTLNMLQARHGQQMHLCPLQFDIVDRLITQHSQPGETVYDPFGGLMTVPYCAVRQGRRGVGVELNAGYFLDGLGYVEAAARDVDAPTLFDALTATADQEAS